MITYRAIELHASTIQIGIVAALYALFPVLLALQFGSWVGKFGEGKFIIAGTFTMVLTSFALIFSNSILTLAIATAFAGVSHLACMVGGQSMVALRAPRENYDRYFGYYTFSAALGHLVGPLIAAAVAAEQVLDLVDEGICDFHFYTMNKADLVYAICHLLGLRAKAA
jgi:MFS family permease